MLPSRYRGMTTALRGTHALNAFALPSGAISWMAAGPRQNVSQMSDSDSDSALLSRAVEGNAAALRTLLKRFGPQAREAIRGKIDKRWQSVLDEDDVMQVAYLEAFLHIDQLTGRDAASFIGWLSRIAQNALRDAIKGLQRQKRPNPTRRVREAPGVGQDSYADLLDLLGGTTATPSRAAARNEAGSLIENALKLLPNDYRTVIRLYDLEGKSVGNVAAEMGR